MQTYVSLSLLLKLLNWILGNAILLSADALSQFHCNLLPGLINSNDNKNRWFWYIMTHQAIRDIQLPMRNLMNAIATFMLIIIVVLCTPIFVIFMICDRVCAYFYWNNWYFIHWDDIRITKIYIAMCVQCILLNNMYTNPRDWHSHKRRGKKNRTEKREKKMWTNKCQFAWWELWELHSFEKSCIETMRIISNRIAAYLAFLTLFLLPFLLFYEGFSFHLGCHILSERASWLYKIQLKLIDYYHLMICMYKRLITGIKSNSNQRMQRIHLRM